MYMNKRKQKNIFISFILIVAAMIFMLWMFVNTVREKREQNKIYQSLIIMEQVKRDNNMTASELKQKIESVCQDNFVIIDVLFYKFEEKQKIVVVWAVEYSNISPSLYISDYDSIEEALLRFIDASSLTAMDMEGNNVKTNANPKLETPNEK